MVCVHACSGDYAQPRIATIFFLRTESGELSRTDHSLAVIVDEVFLALRGLTADMLAFLQSDAGKECRVCPNCHNIFEKQDGTCDHVQVNL